LGNDGSYIWVVEVPMFFVTALVSLSVALANSNSTLKATSGWVIFQAFNWEALSSRGNLYSEISGIAADLASAQINAIWLPPPSQSVDTQGNFI